MLMGLRPSLLAAAIADGPPAALMISSIVIGLVYGFKIHSSSTKNPLPTALCITTLRPMDHWSVRLKAAMERKGLTARELSRVSGVDHESIYKYLKGEVHNPRSPAPDKLAVALGVTVPWLMLGVSEAQPQANEKLGIRRLPVLSLTDIMGMVPTDRLVQFWSGSGVVAVAGDVGDYAAGIAMSDHSMEPVIAPGDILIVDPDAEPIPGRYVLAVLIPTGRALIRRYRPHGQTPQDPIDLIAEHRDFPLVTITRKTGFIVGRVVKRISDI